MRSGMTLNINLKELKEDITMFRYALDDSFFESLTSSEIQKGTLDCQLTIRKAGAFYELDFHIDGVVIVACDRCLDDMEQPVSADGSLTVTLGEEASDDDDLITVDEESGSLDVSWYIYEFVTLSLPIKHVHAPGECNAAMLRYINAYDDSSETSADDADKPVDPRWSKLSELLDKN